MTYHKDGSPVRIGQGVANALARNCGWLANGVRFPTGDNKTHASVLRSLADTSRSAMMCGHHVCELCGWDDGNYGNGEIWTEADGGYWRMPRMLWHYVEAHQYRLPPELDDQLHSGNFSLVDTDGKRRGLRVVELEVPYYIVRAYWNESRYDNLIAFGKAIQWRWMTGEISVKCGMYVAKLNSAALPDLQMALEADPENFPNEIRVELVTPKCPA